MPRAFAVGSWMRILSEPFAGFHRLRQHFDVVVASTCVRPEVIREIVVNRSAGAIHSGDALAAEIDILLVDCTGKTGLAQSARWAGPVHGPRRSRSLLHPCPVRIVGISVTRNGGDPVFRVVGGCVAQVVLGNIAGRIVQHPDAAKLILGGGGGAQPLRGAILRHARDASPIGEIAPGVDAKRGWERKHIRSSPVGDYVSPESATHGQSCLYPVIFKVSRLMS